jgi:NAD(P)-dependent dehydrogenase (short-subunit alcohol dehydrogenase family)
VKTVLITGAGRGLGKAIAEEFHQHNFEVIATDFNEDLLSDFAVKENYTILSLDVSSETDVALVANKVTVAFGNIDVLISNAGVFDFYSLTEAGADRLKKIFDVNVFGLANLTKYFFPLLSKSNGRLIVISSESYKVPSLFQPYTVSKQALEKLYDGIKLELLSKGIKTVLIRPGAIGTKIIDDTINFKISSQNSMFKTEFENFVKSTKQYIGNISTPQKIARIIVKAATVKNPKPVYSINHNPIISLLSLLPKKLKTFIIVKSLK